MIILRLPLTTFAYHVLLFLLLGHRRVPLPPHLHYLLLVAHLPRRGSLTKNMPEKHRKHTTLVNTHGQTFLFKTYSQRTH